MREVGASVAGAAVDGDDERWPLHHDTVVGEARIQRIHLVSNEILLLTKNNSRISTLQEVIQLLKDMFE